MSCCQESVKVWDKKTGNLYRSFRVYGSKIEAIAASPCGLQVTALVSVEASDETPFEIFADGGKLISKCQDGQDKRLEGDPTTEAGFQHLHLHTVGEDRFTAIGRGDGDIGFWTLVKVDGLDSCAEEKDAGGTISTTSKSNNLDSIKSGNSGTTTTSSRRSDNSQECLEPILIWSTAYGKLNAQAASIHGVSGLSSANMKLMKQNGAIGDHITPLQAVNAVMITNKAILQFKKRVQPNGGATRPVAKVVGELPEEERTMGDQKNGGDREDGGERTAAEDREE
ncbi:hypothetical protein BGZ67_008277 [Mortierella alpina]|nr:hypothetical protein BGZ67_008277 [Mortierella alpina]